MIVMWIFLYRESILAILAISFAMSFVMPACAADKSKPSLKKKIVNYDIVYVRYPRHGDMVEVELPDGENPYNIEPGADLVLLHPDGSQDVLVDCRVEGGESLSGGQKNCSVQDPVISYDGKWVYYSKYIDMGIISEKNRRKAWQHLKANCFLFKINLSAPTSQRKEIQLTGIGDGFATSKLAGNGSDDRIKDFGIRDLGTTLLADGRILFTSNRDAVVAARQGVNGDINDVSGSTVSQLFIMDDHNGKHLNKNLHVVGFSNLHQVQHPTILTDGRILFTNWDDVGLRPEYATATLYVDYPNGGHMEQFLEPHHLNKRVEHFATQTSSGNVVVVNYYPKMKTWGFGTLLRMPVKISGPKFIKGLTRIGEDEVRFYSRKGTDILTPHTTGAHTPPKNLSGRYTTPSAAPDDGLLVSYSNGPVSFKPPCKACKQFPRPDAGIYLIPDSSRNVIRFPDTQLLLIKNDPKYNEMWPRAVVPYKAIHGINKPSLTMPKEPYGPTKHDQGLTSLSPIGITGTSSMQNRESAPYGKNRFNHQHGKDGGRDTGWLIQGTDAGIIKNDDIWGVRILVITPDRYHSPWKTLKDEKKYGLIRDKRMYKHIKGYYDQISENWKILGEFPVRNPSGQKDPDGEEDTSWLAKIPANTPFLIQAIDRHGITLTTEQTWRHVAPGKSFATCGGCHAHAIKGVSFKNKWADSSDYKAWDLVNSTPMVYVDNKGKSEVKERSVKGLWGVEFRRDIYPILKHKCASCHSSKDNRPPTNGARLAMFDIGLTGFESEARAYFALAKDKEEKYAFNTMNPRGIPAGKKKYFTPQMSRYVRALQARSSYLIWKIYGKRLDGRKNSTYPGVKGKSYEDLDYERGNCPAPKLLTNTEKGLFSRWIDLGAPINLDRKRMRYTDDTLVPVATMYVKKVENNKLNISLGVLDIESGINLQRSYVTVNVEGKRITSFPLSRFHINPGTHIGSLEVKLNDISQVQPDKLMIKAYVYDNAGNHEEVERQM